MSVAEPSRTESAGGAADAADASGGGRDARDEPAPLSAPCAAVRALRLLGAAAALPAARSGALGGRRGGVGRRRSGDVASGARHEDAVSGRVRAPPGGVQGERRAASWRRATARRATTASCGIATARKTRKTRRFRRVMEARNARKDLADALVQGTALSVAGPRLDDARKEFIARRARRRGAEQVGPAVPAAAVGGPGVVAATGARLACAPAARRHHARRCSGRRRRHDASRRLGLSRAQRRQRHALAVSVGAGP